MNLRPRAASLALLAPLLLFCGGGDRSRSPSCGLALIAGPTLIYQRMLDPRALITDAPRGLPATLPARVAGERMSEVTVAYDGGRIAMDFRGAAFPAQPGYALLVVDDTSQRAMGVLVYNAEGPQHYPALGSVASGTASVPLYGVRVDWASVSNPRCPLLGPEAAAPGAASASP